MLKGPDGDEGPLHPDVSLMKLGLVSMPDENAIVASWIDAGDIHQMEFDDKILFFNNEDILNEQINQTVQDLKKKSKRQKRKKEVPEGQEFVLSDEYLLNHFSKKHKSLFTNLNIEFMSKKG